ncbi:hypothetical protein KS419_09760 [Bacillus tamaricis]|uniref:Uncharacterized protein n=1 Tax=Evansella tamaricis TaxID=2069301 RepID=A0ABS6JEB7_9BACI|nr:hypothetical protein [Evansella tamaricis]
MSEYQEYITEREKFDFFMEQGFKIIEVNESLSGDIVKLKLEEKDIVENLHIKTANGRKYYTNIMIMQLNLTNV